MSAISHEYKLVSLRECPLPDAMDLCDAPDRAAAYWRSHCTGHAAFSPEVESFFVLLLNTRNRVTGHVLVSVGILDSVLVHPREVYRVAIIGGAASILVMHNHPSGDTSPSESDIRITRELAQAGQMLKIPVADHVIIGAGETFTSLRQLGFFYL